MPTGVLSAIKLLPNNYTMVSVSSKEGVLGALKPGFFKARSPLFLARNRVIHRTDRARPSPPHYLRGTRAVVPTGPQRSNQEVPSTAPDVGEWDSSGVIARFTLLVGLVH